MCNRCLYEQVKIYVWYDNEWGYSMRMGDLSHKIAKDYLGA